MLLEAVVLKDDNYSVEYKAGHKGYCHVKAGDYWSYFSLRNDQHVAEAIMEILTYL